MNQKTIFTKDLKNKGIPGIYDLKKTWNPSWFQGNRRQTAYFEGWYFKVVSHDNTQSWAFIPGISLSKEDEHSFVQAINGKTGDTWYFRFPLNAFSYSKDGFDIRISNNRFSANSMTLDLESDEGRFHGSLNFSGRHPFDASLLKPGIMGWYRYVPFMECYHGVVSLDHSVNGTMWANENMLPFSNGKGYIEKDWGTSMPEAWLWMQTNHFDVPNTSLMLSVARIPWIGKTFTGFLGFFLHQGKRYDFATYTGARLKLAISETRDIHAHISDKDFNLTISSQQETTGTLKAPVSGTMQRIIHESIDAKIHVSLKDFKENIQYNGTGNNAGLEVVGDHQLLIP